MSAAVGSGAVADYAAHLYVGTSAWLSCHVPYKRTDPLHASRRCPPALPGRYLVSTEQQTAGVAFERLRDVLLPGAGREGFAELERLAASARPGQRRRRVHAVAERRAHPGRRRARPRRPAQPHAGHDPRRHRPRRARGRRAQRALDAARGRALLPAPARPDRVRRRRRASRRCGRRSWPTRSAAPIHRMADPVSANVRGAGAAGLVALGELRRRSAPRPRAGRRACTRPTRRDRADLRRALHGVPRDLPRRAAAPRRRLAAVRDTPPS